MKDLANTAKSHTAQLSGDREAIRKEFRATEAKLVDWLKEAADAKHTALEASVTAYESSQTAYQTLQQLKEGTLPEFTARAERMLSDCRFYAEAPERLQEILAGAREATEAARRATAETRLVCSIAMGSCLASLWRRRRCRAAHDRGANGAYRARGSSP